MARTIRTAIGLAAGLIVALAASPARACERHGPAALPPAPPPRLAPRASMAMEVDFGAPPLAYYPAPAPPPAVAIASSTEWHGGWHGRWHRGWRAAELRHEYRDLERTRRDFYASWNGNPWARHRFEAWYGGRRAELDRRWARLQG